MLFMFLYFTDTSALQKSFGKKRDQFDWLGSLKQVNSVQISKMYAMSK